MGRGWPRVKWGGARGGGMGGGGASGGRMGSSALPPVRASGPNRRFGGPLWAAVGTAGLHWGRRRRAAAERGRCWNPSPPPSPSPTSPPSLRAPGEKGTENADSGVRRESRSAQVFVHGCGGCVCVCTLALVIVRLFAFVWMLLDDGACASVCGCRCECACLSE